jgi:hypothetical protein
VGNCVGEEVGEHLGQAAVIGLDVPIHVDLNLNGPLGLARLYLRKDAPAYAKRNCWLASKIERTR